MLLGAVNGLLIGYLRLRAFITTLITLIIYRSAYDLLLFDYSNTIAAACMGVEVQVVILKISTGRVHWVRD